MQSGTDNGGMNPRMELESDEGCGPEDEAPDMRANKCVALRVRTEQVSCASDTI